MEILCNNFLVYGTGKSGTSAAEFLLKMGAKNVYVYDDNKASKIPCTTLVKNFKEITSLNLTAVVLSPGVCIYDNKNIELIKQNNIELISEFMLGFMFTKGTTICVTGTNGKTTTVNLIYKLLKSKYNQVFLCGNTEVPITKIALNTTLDSFVVCEVSSFMLECINSKFVPNISAILNISSDHISWHKTMQNYINAKHNITKFQTNKNTLIFNSNLNINSNAQKISYAINNINSDCYIKNNYVIFKNKKIISKKIIKLLGNNNLENILCAILVAKNCGLKNAKIKSVIKNFLPLNHRMQIVHKFNNVTYINDSKATNPNSTVCALTSLNFPTILLLGGSDKGYSYDDIFSYCQNVKQIVAFGQMANKIKECAHNNNFTDVCCFNTLADAVKFAKYIADSGDIVLLSPACASFDEFNSYKQRGEEFTKLVRENND